jgi:hypothetical protein
MSCEVIMAIKSIEPKRFFVAITFGDESLNIYQIGDYAIDLDMGFLFLYANSKKDVRPMGIYNLGVILSIEFFDEEPKIEVITESPQIQVEGTKSVQ